MRRWCRVRVTVEYDTLVQSRKETAIKTAIFTRDMSIMEALQADPRARDILEGHGVDCVGCSGIVLESIERGTQVLGLDVDAILAELNSLVPAGTSEQE